MDLFAFFLGFGIGVVITFLVIYLSMRSRVPVEKSAELVSMWSIRELGLEVKGIIESAGNIDLPPGSMVVVRDSSSIPQKMLDSCEVRTNPDVKGNVLLGHTRAFVFSGIMSKSSMVMVTEDDDLLLRLSNHFNNLWASAQPYAEVVSIKDLMDNIGRYVKIAGHVTSAKPFKGNPPYSCVLRVINMGVGVDILTDKEYDGDVEVIGKVRENRGTIAVDSLFVKELS